MAGAKMTVDGREYEVESLSEGAKAQLLSLQGTDQEIARLQNHLAIFQTARNAYLAALRQELEVVRE